jgi:hypothetical protein
MYLACKARAQYCHLLPYRLDNILTHNPINGKIFEGKKVTEQEMYVLVFSTTLSETFLILRRTERDTIKNVYWSPCKVPVIVDRFLKKLGFSRKIFEKYSNIQFHEHGSWDVPCGRTDSHDKANSCYSQVSESAKKMVRCSLLTPATSISRQYIWACLSLSLSLSKNLLITCFPSPLPTPAKVMRLYTCMTV